MKKLKTITFTLKDPHNFPITEIIDIAKDAALRRSEFLGLTLHDVALMSDPKKFKNGSVNWKVKMLVSEKI